MKFDFTKGMKARYSVHVHYWNGTDVMYYHYWKEAKAMFTSYINELTARSRAADVVVSIYDLVKDERKAYYRLSSGKEE